MMATGRYRAPCVGSSAGWEALEALTGEPTATDLLAMTDADLLTTTNDDINPQNQQPLEDEQPLAETTNVRNSSGNPALASRQRHGVQHAQADMWAGLLLMGLIVAAACVVGGTWSPRRPRTAKHTA